MLTTGKTEIKRVLVPLRLLDLSRCSTVNDIVCALAACSFGARHVGEVANRLEAWFRSQFPPAVIYDGEENSPLHQLLKAWREEGWVNGVYTSAEYLRPDSSPCSRQTLVIGPYSEREAERLYAKAEGMIFINQFGQCRPGLTRDGYFPNVVFGDPRFVAPLIHTALLERLSGKASTVRQLMADLGGYGGMAEDVARSADVWRQMDEDPDCSIFLTLSGAMTAAQMSLLITDMIERFRGLRYIAATGALMCHGLVGSLGHHHYKYDPKHTDDALSDESLNRITDTIEPEENLDHVEDAIREVLQNPVFDGENPIAPSAFHAEIGRYLREHFPHHRAILKSAFERSIPIAVPAFVDSEIGNDVFLENLKRSVEGKRRLIFDPELDTAVLLQHAISATKMGIISIGGGTPRNNTQNVAPLSEIINHRFNGSRRVVKFSYGSRIDPAPGYIGTMGSATFSEMISWRKAHKDGIYAEVRADATMVWPFLLKYVLECQDQRARSRLGA